MIPFGLPLFSTYGVRVSSGISFIPVYRSYRYTVHTGIPFIPVYRSYRYTVPTGIPFIPVYRSYRYTVHNGTPFIPVYCFFLQIFRKIAWITGVPGKQLRKPVNREGGGIFITYIPLLPAQNILKLLETL